MKRFIALLLGLTMVLLLAGCQRQAPAAVAPAKSLRDRGAELVPRMAEMATSPYYASAYTEDPGITEALAQVAQGDFTAPQAVYCIRFPESALNQLMEQAGLTGLDGLSQELREGLKDRAFASLPTQINAMAGAEKLAAASICTAGELFVDPSVTENVIYLYVYRNAVPAAVVFHPGEDGAVSASGTLILYDGFPLGSLEDISGVLGPLGAEVSEVS